MSNVTDIFPANKFSTVAENAAREIEVGIVIGFNSNDELCVYGGGLLLNGRQPVSKDFLWMVEKFKSNLIAGHYGPS